MPGRRATTPLFDLLQTGRARAVEHRVPDPPVEHHAPPPRPVERSPSREPANTSEAPIRLIGGVVQMPLVFAGVALAVWLVAVLGAWTIGYNRGQARERADQAMLESVLGPSAKVVEPGTEKPSDSASQIQNKPQDSPPSPQGAGRFITSSGLTDQDPRAPRHNYLHLAARLERDSIDSAMAALAARGIDSFAEVDPSTLKRKDGPLYSLIAGRGIPSGETGSAEARRYLDEIRAAGAAWKQAGGIWDFADAYWKLY